MPSPVQGTLINKADTVFEYNARVPTFIEPQIIWYTGSGLPTNFPAGQLADNILPDMVVADIADAIEIADNLTALMVAFTTVVTAVRRVRYRRIISKTNCCTGSPVMLNVTRLASLKPAYQQVVANNGPAFDIDEGELNEAVDLNAYILNLQAQWIDLKDNTVMGGVFDFFFCHCSCHCSHCHSSRNRR